MSHTGSRHVRVLRRLLILALLATLPGAYPRAGQATSSFKASIQVVRPHQPELARALPVPLPLPGYVISEDAAGLQYYFEGSMRDARAYYVAQMQRLGYTLRSERAGENFVHSMHWQREDHATVVQLRAVAGMTPTRISLRVSKEDARAPG